MSDLKTNAIEFIQSKLSGLLPANNQQEGPTQVYLKNQVSTLRYQVSQLLGVSHDNERDIYTIYGYDNRISFDSMWQYSRRHGVANRMTHGIAKSCWRDGFEIFESSEDDAIEILKDEIGALKKIGLIKRLEQADILNRIGKYSVLFVGVPDGLSPDQPVGKVSGDKISHIYFKAFAYDGVEIEKQVTDPKDSRYGLPEMYTVSKRSRGNTEKDISLNSMRVHWSRIVHLNENALDSDIEGMGALEPIFNRILDLDKATGGSSEAYFRNAKGKIGYEIDKDFATSIATDTAQKAAFDEGAKKYTNQFQDHTIAAGAKLKVLNTPHASPRDTVMAALWEISSYTKIPIRLLIGEGSGQLAGSEDQLAYNAIVAGRQNVDCCGWIVDVLTILSNAGMMELPEDFDVRFPVQQAVTEAQAAEIAKITGDTIKVVYDSAVASGGELDAVATLKNIGIDVEIDTTLDDLGVMEDE